MFKNTQNHNYFEEQFEESEANINDRIYEQVTYTKNSDYRTQENKPSVYNQQDQIPIQLLKLLPSGKFEINFDAIDLINSYNKSVGIVCLAGKYRTGKSFLLNKLLGLKGNGFKVDSSTTACTEGIWMWSKPMYNPKEDCYLFFIDTQGSQSTNRDSDHDAKIFTLGILMSSYFIYNSVGAIDETSISQLNLVTTLSKNIIVSEDNNQGNLHNYMPKFLWVLRDFILQTRNQYGEKLSPQEYLQSCLLQQNSQIKSNPAVRNVRRAMVNLFRDRDCMMMVRPAALQDDLKNLNSLPESRLRPQFLEGISILKNKILNNAGPKQINGESSNSLMLTELIIAYTNTINDEGIPNITSAWQHLGEQAALDAYDDALDVYNQKYELYFSVDEPKGEQIHTILKEMRDEALDTYDYGIDAPNQRIRNKLKNLIIDKEKAIVNVNNELNEARNVEVLRDCSQDLMRNLQLGKYSAQNPKLLTQDLNNMINQYNTKAIGPRKCEVLSMFLTNFNPIIIKSYTETTKTKISSSLEKVAASNQVNYDNEQTIEILQQRIRSMEQQMNSRGNYNNAETDQLQNQLRIQNDTMKKQIQAMRNRKDGTKCCLLF